MYQSSISFLPEMRVFGLGSALHPQCVVRAGCWALMQPSLLGRPMLKMGDRQKQSLRCRLCSPVGVAAARLPHLGPLPAARCPLAARARAQREKAGSPRLAPTIGGSPEVAESLVLACAGLIFGRSRPGERINSDRVESVSAPIWLCSPTLLALLFFWAWLGCQT